ncbi:hypothetical protein JCM8547_007941 [Rhodosporidiobolus lusitaniae]
MPPARQDSRSLTKARYIPAVSSSSESSESEAELREEGVQLDSNGRPLPSINPLDPLRRGSVLMEFIGAGAISLGSTLVISLYVCGLPRLNDLATASTAVLFLTLFLGCLGAVPSWLAALLMLFSKKEAPNDPPKHGKLLRLAALAAFFIVLLYSIATVVLSTLVSKKDSFVAFCMQNIDSATEEECTDRWNRDWIMWLAVGIVLIFHAALGFPVYRYTRGTEHGKQLESGFLLEVGKTASPTSGHPLQRRRSRWDSSSEEDEDDLKEMERELALAKKRRRERRSSKRSKRASQYEYDSRRGSADELDAGSTEEGEEEGGERKWGLRRGRGSAGL